MAESSVDIDRVVREVLAELRQTPPPESRPGAATPGLESGSSAEELVLDCRVITMTGLGARLDGARLDGVRRLVVPPGAVVTPSVRDALRRKNVVLSFTNLSFTNPAFAATSDDQAAEVRLVLVAAVTSYDPAALVGALRDESIHVESDASDCLIEVADKLAEALREPRTLGVVLTSRRAVALCLANRLDGVRAISGDNAAEVAQSAESVGANLLVIDPAGKGVFPLKRMVLEFRRAGVRECPEVLRGRLG